MITILSILIILFGFTGVMLGSLEYLSLALILTILAIALSVQDGV